MSYFRSHNCGELSVQDIDKKVFVSGWINKKRDHGGVLFVDSLSDKNGPVPTYLDLLRSTYETVEKGLNFQNQ